MSNLLTLVSKVTIAASNIWIFTLKNLYFIPLVNIMDQISSNLHVVGLKLKTTQPIIVWDAINKCIMIYLLTEDSQFQALFILLLASQAAGRYRYNHL